MGAPVINMTKKELDASIKDVIGGALAEHRQAMEAKGKELMEKHNPPPGFVAGALPDKPVNGDYALVTRVASIMACAKVAKVDSGAALLAIAEKRYGRDEKVFERIKGLGISELTGAGALAQEQMSSDFIELLRPRVVVRTLGAMIEDMPGGQTTIPKQTGDGAAEWVGETPSQNATEPSFGQIKMVAKKLRAIIPIPNDAIRRGTNIEQRVQTTMVQQIRRAEDIAFIRGTGTAFTPKGIRNWAPAANLIPATALAGDATDHRVVNADLAKLVLAHQQADVAGERPGWMFAPRTNVFLQTLLTSDGQYAFRAEMLAGSLWGAAFGVTSQIPINLSTNKSEVYYVDFVDVKIGDTQSITVQAFDQMAYHDANGVLQSAAERDETVVIVQEETDLAVRNEESVAVLTGVGWGA